MNMRSPFLRVAPWRLSLALGLPVAPASAGVECRGRVATENLGNHHLLVASNDGVAPVYLRVFLTQGENVASDRTWPLRAVLLPRQSLQLARLYAAAPNAGACAVDVLRGA